MARSSLEELLLDYEDYLRVRGLEQWHGVSPEARFIRSLGSRHDETYEDYRIFCETRSAEVVANIAICLVRQATFLLDQQIRRLEQDFLKEGGVRERMTRARIEERKRRR